jgi:hypothetical protein
MKADVQSPAEKEALQWAVDFFQRCAPFLSRDASKRHSVVVLALYLSTLRSNPDSDFDDQLTSFIEAAPKEPHAAAVLCEFAAQLMERGDQLPSQLRSFIVEFLRNPSMGTKRKRGPDKYAGNFRNVLIGFAIVRIAETWKLPPTRNAATKDGEKRASAASIVREGLREGARLRMSEEGINDIWGGSPWALRNRLRSAKSLDELPALLMRMKKLYFSHAPVQRVGKIRRI